MHSRRLVWRLENQEEEWKTSTYDRTQFGDVPTATRPQVTKKLNAEEGKKIAEEESNGTMKKKRFCRRQPIKATTKKTDKTMRTKKKNR